LARDDFSKETKDILAKRVGMRCSCPECRKPTSGPDAMDGVTNIGVAAHISAASRGGPRFDNSMTPIQRSDISNGIWLCQNHAKLIDNDELNYTLVVLQDWKATAEHMAALEARGYAVKKAAPFGLLESKFPKLISEMRQDISNNPHFREFIILPDNGIAYHSKNNQLFCYHENEHDALVSAITILKHHGAAYEITNNNTPRFNFTEEFVLYLIGEIS
jgi:hypothetical protein